MKPNTKGFDESHIKYLVGHAQQMHPLDDFHKQVQKHLDEWDSPEDEEEQAQELQKEGLAKMASMPKGTPPPALPKPPSAPPPAPSMPLAGPVGPPPGPPMTAGGPQPNAAPPNPLPSGSAQS